MSTTTDALDTRIAAIDADILRIQASAATQVAELESTKTALQTMKATLVKNPELEALMAKAKLLGVL